VGEIADLQKKILDFVTERDWDQYHTPKNLAMALGNEVGELLGEFRWKSDEDLKNLSQEDLQAIAHEIADSSIFLLRLADVLGIDIAEAITEKMKIIDKRKYIGPDLKK
jgi:NTP pyrophosphatase (non-canonical NTP hydrolase)